MLAPRNRGALLTVTAAVLALVSACSNGTEPKNVCDASNPVTLTPGAVEPAISGTCVYINSTDAGEYALVPFNADTTYAHTVTLAFTSHGASAVSSVLELTPFSPTPELNLIPGPGSGTPSASYDYDVTLRQSERRVLKPLIAGARALYSRGATSGSGGTRLRPSFSTTAATWNVGDLVNLNTKSGDTFADACTTPDIRTGRVVAISTHAIVVADTANPTGGYTDTEYQAIGVAFDSVYTMDTNAFGTPTDIDNNQHIVMFFTRAVNELTPPSSSSVVGGFFYARDLFPTQDSPDLGPNSGCATSNYAEMFYLAVPDPNALVNGNKSFTKTFVSHLSVSTTAHEFQHLINASRRLYVNTSASDFEVVWLNEGLSHIAEELLFYQQSQGLAPRMDIDSMAFRTNQTNVNAYNYDQASNFGRFKSYLARPSKSSPYAPDDSLWTRGATWSFLRYAADHRGSNDGTTWLQLVNSTTTGIPNLLNVFGSGLYDMFRDWSIAKITDDVPGVPSQWQALSWNFKSIFHYIGNHQIPVNTNAYTLTTVSLSDASPASVTLNGGGAAYVRFGLAAGQTGSVKWDTQATNVKMSLVRLK